MRLGSKHLWTTLMILASYACGTVAGNPGEDDDDGTVKAVAPVRFALTDASVDGAKSVLISVESLEVSVNGEGWVAIPLKATAEIDLLQLQDGKAMDLGELPELPVGTYGQTRLKLKEGVASMLILDDGSEHELTIPSAEQTGIKINTSFTHAEGAPLDLTIDFDLRQSIKKTGSGNGNGNGNGKDKYMMKPVQRHLRNDGSGTVTGAADGKVACLFASGSTKAETDDCDGLTNSGKVKDGTYKIAFVPAGTYDLRIFKDDGTYVDVAGIVVTAGQDTTVGN